MSITCFKKLNMQDKWFDEIMLNYGGIMYDKILSKSSTTNVSQRQS